MSFAATPSTSADSSRHDSNGNITRTVLVMIRGTPASFDSLGGEAGSWTLAPEQAVRIFARDPNMHPDTAMSEIRNVILRRLRLIEYKTNAPDVCGLHIEGLPGNEFTQAGDDSHIWLLGKGQSTQPHDIFVASGDTELGMQWMREYPSFTKQNIRSKDVMRLHGADYYFVNERHPVIHLLYNNQEALGTKIDASDKVNGEWYRINLEVFDDSCHTLDTQVFNKTPQVFDLSKLRIKLRRPDNKRWVDTPLLHDELMDTSDVSCKKEAFKRYMNTPIYVCARMGVDYAIPPMVEDAAAAATGTQMPGGTAGMPHTNGLASMMPAAMPGSGIPGAQQP